MPWIIAELRALPLRPAAPLLLMSYLNPLLAYGLERLAVDAAAAGVSGFIVPDLPYEESADFVAEFIDYLAGVATGPQWIYASGPGICRCGFEQESGCDEDLFASGCKLPVERCGSLPAKHELCECDRGG